MTDDGFATPNPNKIPGYIYGLIGFSTVALLAYAYGLASAKHSFSLFAVASLPLTAAIIATHFLVTTARISRRRAGTRALLGGLNFLLVLIGLYVLLAAYA